MEKIDINVISQSNDLRLYVLEHTILIEEHISATLGALLNIEWQTSKSFGFNSSALSFNQKVQIVQDIEGLEKIEIQKLTDLMSIRNKFAHVRSIITFEDFFGTGVNGKSIKRNLEKWYNTDATLEFDDEETKYKHFFFLLAVEVILIIWMKRMNYGFREKSKNKEINQNKIQLETLENALKKFPGGKLILNFAYEKAMKKMKTVKEI